MSEVFCCKRVFDGRAGSHQCANKPSIEVHGKHYCRIHSPEYEAKQKAKRDAAYNLYSKKLDHKYKTEEARRKVTAYAKIWVKSNKPGAAQMLVNAVKRLVKLEETKIT